MNWDNKTILLIGGTGSFGTAFLKKLMSEHKPHAIRIFSRCEHKQSDLLHQYENDNVSGFIGDIRDKDRLMMAMADVDIVIHTAALKCVQSCEYNPFETIKTNIMGSMNIIEAALANNVDKVLAISTDKACSPLNLYGATKMCMEKLFVHANNYRGLNKRTKFSCTRYGNVVGSRGSVVPIWKDIIKHNGVISVNDPKATRFWFKMKDATQFVADVLEAMDKYDGGEIFVPKIPSINIMALWHAMTNGLSTFNVSGLRVGDKLHETLILPEEIHHTVETDLGYIIYPEGPHWKYVKPEGTLPGYREGYRSDNNLCFLNTEEIKEMLTLCR